MYAIFKVSGFQFGAEEGTTVRIPTQNVEGKKLTIDEVLFIKDGDQALIGAPVLDGARIEAEVVGDTRGEKLLLYKYKRRTKYRRTQGHRQNYTEIKVNRIVRP